MTSNMSLNILVKYNIYDNLLQSSNIYRTKEILDQGMMKLNVFSVHSSY